MPLSPGTHLGPYEVVSFLGSGGMGEVYQARDGRLHRMVAVKILPPEAGRADRRRRFVQEAQLASSLHHPHIVTIFDIGSAEGVDYLAMELVKGRPLAAAIPPRGMRLSDALRFGIQIADALSAAHAAGIVHRDLKPGNIMVTDEGQIKILDFGLATLTEGALHADESATRTVGALVSTEDGLVVGTVAYMSPEQAEGQKVDARTDLFSFGAILYEMLSGQRAFRGNSPAGTLAAVINTEPEPLTTIVPEIPQPVERLVSRCLRKDISRRAQHASDVKLTLEELHEDSTSGSRAAVPSSSAKSGRAIRWAIAGAVILALLAIAAVAMWPRTPAPARSRIFTPVPLTSLPGSEVMPSLSPDGSQVAFTWLREAPLSADVYVHLVGSGGAPLRLTDDGSAHVQASWSPDGTSIAMWHVSRGTMPGAVADMRLVIVSPLRGPEREVLEWNSEAQRIAWSRDSRWLAISQAGTQSHREKGITLVSPLTGERIDWASIDPAYAGSMQPALSPDGRRVAFIRTQGNLLSEVYVADVGADGKPSGSERRVVELTSNAPAPVWTADGEHLLVLDGASTTARVVRVPVDGTAVPEPLAGLEHATDITLAPNGSRLAFSRGGMNTHLWRVDLLNAAASGRVAETSMSEDGADYSPDGRRIAFASNRLGSREIWVADANGENPLQLTQFGGPVPGSSVWSPTVPDIAFDGRPAGNADIFVVSSTGGPVRQLTKDASEDARPAWSRDGAFIYFSSNRSGRAEVWRMTRDGGNPTQITKTGALSIAVSFDGQWVYYSTPLSQIRRIRSDGTGDEVVLPNGAITFTTTPTGLWFVARPVAGELRTVIREFQPATRTIRDITKVDFLPGAGRMSVSPDQHFIIVNELPRGGSDLLYVDGFQ